MDFLSGTSKAADMIIPCLISYRSEVECRVRCKEEVAEKLRQGFEDQAKMAELADELSKKRYSKSADTIDRFSQDIWNHRAFLKSIGRRLEPLTGWNGSTRNLSGEVE